MLYPRFILPKILEALAESLVVLVNGARWGRALRRTDGRGVVPYCRFLN